MVTIPGLPVPRIMADPVSAQLPPGQYALGVQFAIGEITLCGNTGTYVGSPFHRYADQADLAALPLGRLAELDGVVVDVTGAAARAIGRAHFIPYRVKGKAVLVRTGWDRHWGTGAYAGEHPFLTAEAAAHLVRSGGCRRGSRGSARSRFGRTRPGRRPHEGTRGKRSPELRQPARRHASVCPLTHCSCASRKRLRPIPPP